MRSSASRACSPSCAALADLQLDRLIVLYPGDRLHPLAEKVEVLPLESLVEIDPRSLVSI